MMTLDFSLKHLSELTDILLVHAPLMEVLLYGSRVTGGAHPASDLDLVVRNPHAPDQPCAALGRIRDAIAESNIPILIDFHDWALLPATFRRDITAKHLKFNPAEFQQAARQVHVEGEAL